MNIHTSDNSLLWSVVAISVAILYGGCAKSNDDLLPTTSPIIIDANACGTRASNELGNKYSDFGVWAWKTYPDNSTSLVIGRKPDAIPFSEYITRLFDGKWSYAFTDAAVTQYLRYWDPAASSYRFSAYAPFTLEGEKVNLTHNICASTAGVSISDISGNIPIEVGIDWLEAHWERQLAPALIDIDLISDENHIISQIPDAVSLAFHHILAVTQFRIYSLFNTDIKLTNISISLNNSESIKTKGDYSEGGWNYTSGNTSSQLLNLSSSIDLSPTYSVLTSLLQLPQNVDGFTVNIDAETDDGFVRSCSFQLTGEWEAGKQYIYTLCLLPYEIILMDFTATPWTSGDDIIVIDPVVNW